MAEPSTLPLLRERTDEQLGAAAVAWRTLHLGIPGTTVDISACHVEDAVRIRQVWQERYWRPWSLLSG